MENAISTSYLLRLVGVMAVCVGAAWAFQVVGLGGSTAFGRLAWVISAAVVAGGGTGLILTSASVREDGTANS